MTSYHAAQSPIETYPTKEMAQKSNLGVGARFQVSSIDNAPFTVQPSVYVLLPGDIAIQGGLIAAMDELPNGGYSGKWFGALGDGATSDQAAVQLAYSRGGMIHWPAGVYPVESVSVDGGSGIIGESHDVTMFVKIPDTDGHMFVFNESPYNVILRSFYIDGQKNLNTDGNYWDNLHFTSTSNAGMFSCLADDVYSERSTGRTWYVGPNRNKPTLRTCYGYNAGTTGNLDGDGILLDSVSDAYIGVASGFGSCQGRSVLVKTCATPVVEHTEIWWANNTANVQFFQCKDFMLRGCNLDRCRDAALRVDGRVGSGLDTPDGFHENSFVQGNTFKNPKGAGGAGSDGDGNFIKVSNSKGLIVSGNNFNYDPAAGDVKVDYIISTDAGVSTLCWDQHSNNAAKVGDAYQCYVTGITNVASRLDGGLTPI